MIDGFQFCSDEIMDQMGWDEIKKEEQRKLRKKYEEDAALMYKRRRGLPLDGPPFELDYSIIHLS